MARWIFSPTMFWVLLKSKLQCPESHGPELMTPEDSCGSIIEPTSFRTLLAVENPQTGVLPTIRWTFQIGGYECWPQSSA